MAYALDDAARRRMGLPPSYGTSSYGGAAPDVRPQPVTGPAIGNPSDNAPIPLGGMTGQPVGSVPLSAPPPMVAPDVSIRPTTGPTTQAPIPVEPGGSPVTGGPFQSMPATPLGQSSTDPMAFANTTNPSAPPPIPRAPMSLGGMAGIGSATPDPVLTGGARLTPPTQYMVNGKPVATPEGLAPGQGVDTWTGQPMFATGKDGAKIPLDQNGAPIGDVPLDYYGPSTHIYTENAGGDPHGFANGVSLFNAPGATQIDPAKMAALQRAQVSGSVDEWNKALQAAGFPPGMTMPDLAAALEPKRAPSELAPGETGVYDAPSLQLPTPSGPARNGGYYDASNAYHPGNEKPAYGLENGMYVDANGMPIASIGDAPYGIDPVTHKPLTAPAGSSASAPPLGSSSPAAGRPTGAPPIPRPPVAGGGTPSTTPDATVGLPRTGTGTGPPPVREFGPGGNHDPSREGVTPTAPSTSGSPVESQDRTLNPDDSLLGKVITPQTLIDRFKLAQESFGKDVEATNPEYEATLRDANRYSFGAGRGVSGAARNSIGDIASQRMKQMDAMRTNYLNTALTGSIDDAYKNIGIEQQQQGFQKDLADTAFGQNYAVNQLQDSLTNSDFQRWLQGSEFAQGAQAQDFGQQVTKAQLADYLTNSQFNRSSAQQQAGFAENPAQIQLLLSNIFGNQSSSAMQAVAKLFSGLGAKSGSGSSGSSGSSSDAFLKMLMDEINRRSGGGANPGTPYDGGYPYEPE